VPMIAVTASLALGPISPIAWTMLPRAPSFESKSASISAESQRGYW